MKSYELKFPDKNIKYKLLMIRIMKIIKSSDDLDKILYWSKHYKKLSHFVFPPIEDYNQ